MRGRSTLTLDRGRGGGEVNNVFKHFFNYLTHPFETALPIGHLPLAPIDVVSMAMALDVLREALEGRAIAPRPRPEAGHHVGRLIRRKIWITLHICSD